MESLLDPVNSAVAAEQVVIAEMELQQQVQILPATDDIHGGVIVELKEKMASTAFASILRASVSHWRCQGKKGVWIKIPIEQANLVDAVVKEGFRYHHAEADYLMVVRWLPQTEQVLPANATPRLGIGAFAIKGNREVLQVKDNGGVFKRMGLWKLPTGFAEEGEGILADAVRKVKEVTDQFLKEDCSNLKLLADVCAYEQWVRSAPLVPLDFPKKRRSPRRRRVTTTPPLILNISPTVIGKRCHFKVDDDGADRKGKKKMKQSKMGSDIASTSYSVHVHKHKGKDKESGSETEPIVIELRLVILQ